MIILHKEPLKLLDQIHASEELKEKTLQNTLAHRKQHKLQLWKFAIPVSLCFVLLFFMLPKQPDAIGSKGEKYSYIAVDINPSFELVLNEKNIVMDINVFNEDADVLLSGLEIKGNTYEEAMSQIIACLQQENYLDLESYLQVSVYSSDEIRMQEIESVISNYLDQTIQTPHDCMQINSFVHENAESHHMSSGKYDIAQSILAQSEQYSLEELNSFTMSELRDIYERLTNTVWSSGEHENCDNAQNQHQRKGNGHHN